MHLPHGRYLACLFLLSISGCLIGCEPLDAFSRKLTVTINPTSATLSTNGTQQFSASVANGQNSVTWSATGGNVSATGLYTAPATGGTYTVTATSVADRSKSASARVTVTTTTPTAVSISITPSTASLTTSGTAGFTATVSNTSNTAVTWSVSAGAITGSGNSVTYVAPSTAGTYTVTATSVADTTKKASAAVTVTASPVIAVSINPATASLTSGASTTFAATVSNTSNTAVSWSVTGGTMSGSGNTMTYTAPAAAGTYVVTATSVADSTKKASATVTVAAAIAVSITPASTTLASGASASFSASVANTSNTGVTWSVTGGTISSTGNTASYTAPASAGTYTVKATSVADTTKSASATVTVTATTGNGGFEGYGATVTGGTGQPVVNVTNLNDSGAGSLRAALGANRIIRFSVAGTITLQSPLVLNMSNVTVDGFSAPSPGITINSTGSGSSNGDCLDIWGPGQNIVVQGLRFRSCGNDDIQIAQSASKVVVDHVSTSGSGDGNIDITGAAHDITVSWSILSGNNDASGAQLISYDANRISLHHNIYYDNHGNARVPWAEAGWTGVNTVGRDIGLIADIRYNIMWNFLIGTMFDTDTYSKSYGNVVSNLYNSEDTSHARNTIIINGGGLVTAYVAGNASVLDVTGCPFYISAQPVPACITKTNDPNNHAEYPVPAIAGPTPADNQGRLDTWTSVYKQAGVATHYADDTEDARVRSGIAMPTLSLFSQPWNQ